jgi:hypothetical protein
MEDFKKARVNESDETIKSHGADRPVEKNSDREEQQESSQNYSYDEYDSYSPWG